MLGSSTPGHMEWTYTNTKKKTSLGLSAILSIPTSQVAAIAGNGVLRLVNDGCFDVWGGYLGVEQAWKNMVPGESSRNMTICRT